MLKMLAVWIAWRPRRWRISGASAGSTGVASRTSAPGARMRDHRGLESGGDRVEVGLGPQDVVAAADHADEVGPSASASSSWGPTTSAS